MHILYWPNPFKAILFVIHTYISYLLFKYYETTRRKLKEKTLSDIFMSEYCLSVLLNGIMNFAKTREYPAECMFKPFIFFIRTDVDGLAFYVRSINCSLIFYSCIYRNLYQIACVKTCENGRLSK